MNSLYHALFNFIAEERLKQQDIDPRKIHASLVVTLTTGILMWVYALTALFTIQSPIPGIVGIVASTIHLMAPLFFRFTKSDLIVVCITLGAGIIHQGTYSFFTGGFSSHVLIWFGILPMLAAIVSGRAAAFLWFFITTLWAFIYLFLHLSGYEFPNLISSTGHLLTQIFLVFGYIFLTSSITYVYLSLNEKQELQLKEQAEKIDNLFRVLFHDLASPISRLHIALGMVRKSTDSPVTHDNIDIAQRAVDSMVNITQNVRKVYAAKKAKAENELCLCSVAEAIDHVRGLYLLELTKKNLSIDFDSSNFHDSKVLVEPVSFKNQVLGNLISNAIKFSPPNSVITIEISADQKGYLCLGIADQGIGIPSTILKNLFDLNKKTTRPGTEGETGTGFGLHVVRSFVEMYQGQIFVESAENVGTKIKLILKSE